MLQEVEANCTYCCGSQRDFPWQTDNEKNHELFGSSWDGSLRSLMCLCRSNSLKSRPNNLSWNLPSLRFWLYGKMGTSPNLAWLEAPTGGKWGPSTSTRPRFGSGGKSLGNNSVLRLLKASRRLQWFVEVWSCGCALPKYARGRDGTSFACVAT